MVIANDRLIKIEDGEVFFWYKDDRDGNRRKVHHLPGVAFLARFLQHILPRGLHNKRRYGFWDYQGLDSPVENYLSSTQGKSYKEMKAEIMIPVQKRTPPNN